MKKRKLFLFLAVVTFLQFFLWLAPSYAGGGKDDDGDSGDSQDSWDYEDDDWYDSEPSMDYSSFSDDDLVNMAEEAEENGDLETADDIHRELDHRYDSKDKALRDALDKYNEKREQLAEGKAKYEAGSKELEELEQECINAYKELEKAVEDYNNFNDSMDKYDYFTGTPRENVEIYTIGDPVDISSGAFSINKNDFGIFRNYNGGNFFGGSFGSVWSCGWDTRLIRGVDLNAQQELEKAESMVTDLESIRDSMSDAASSYSECFELLVEAEALLQEAKVKRDEIALKAQKSSLAQSMNVFTNYGPFSSSVNCGLDYFLYITETGNPILFKKESENEWLPTSQYFRQFYSLKSDGSSFVVSKFNGIKWYFSSYGLPEKKVYRNGNTDFYQVSNGRVSSVTTFDNCSVFVIRDSLGRIISAYTDDGRFINYEYNGNLMQKVYDSEGDVFKFEYSENYITKYIAPDNSVTSFEYTPILSNGKRKTSATINAEGKKETFSYDDVNRTVIHTDYSGVKTICTYDENGKTKSIRTMDGKFVTYDYDSIGNLLRKQTECESILFSYNKNGQLLSSTYSDGSKQEYIYDKNGLLTSYTDRDGISVFYSYNEKGNCINISNEKSLICSYSYDDSNRCTSINYTDGTEERFVYDERNNCIEKNTIGIENGVLSSFSEFFSYDIKDRLVEYTDSSGDKTKFSYEPHSILSVSPEKLQTQIITDSAKNIIAEIKTDLETGEQRRTDILYNKINLPIEIYSSGIASDGTVFKKHKIASYTYDDSGKIKTRIEYGTFDKYIFDNEGDGNFADGNHLGGDSNLASENSITNVGLDINKDSESSNMHSSKHIFLQEIGSYNDFDSPAILESYSYNELGQISNFYTCRLDNFGKEIPNTKIENSFLYFSDQPNTIAVCDSLDNKYIFTKNSSGKVISEILPSGIEFIKEFSPAGRILKTQSAFGGFYFYEYDNTGMIAKMGEENTLGCNLTYSNLGKLEKYTSVDGSTVSFTYDLRGNVLCKKSENNSIEYAYDKKGRCIQKVILDKNGEICVKSDFVYSKDGRNITKIDGDFYKTQIKLNAFLEIVSLSGVENTGFVYDDLGRTISITDGESNTYKIEYDATNSPSRVIAPDGSVTRTTYTANAKLLKQFDAMGICVQENTYDERGLLKSSYRRPGEKTNYFYDNNGHLIEVWGEDNFELKYDVTPYQRQIKTIDAKGNVFTENFNKFGKKLSETNRLNKSQFFEYDDIGRIKTKRKFSQKKIKYDYNDTMQTKNVSYNDGTSILTKYDVVGNIIHSKSNDSEFFYEYDKAGVLISLTDVIADVKVLYSYDSKMNCISKKGCGREIYYEYDNCGRVTSILDKSTSLSVKFVYDKCGREILRTFGNGIKHKTEYDKAGKIIYYQVFNENNVLLSAKGYIYDSNNHLTHEVFLNGNVNRFSFNSKNELRTAEYSSPNGEYTMQLSGAEYASLQNRLIQISNGKSLYCPITQSVSKTVYEYDENKNLSRKTTKAGTSSYSYDSENRLQNIKNVLIEPDTFSDITCTWDDDGNLLSKVDALKSLQFTYSAQNRMNSASTQNFITGEINKTFYTYDSFGRRVSILNDDNIVYRTVYDGFKFDSLAQSPALAGKSILTNLLDKNTNYNANELTDSINCDTNYENNISDYRYLEKNQYNKEENTAKTHTHNQYDAINTSSANNDSQDVSPQNSVTPDTATSSNIENNSFENNTTHRNTNRGMKNTNKEVFNMPLFARGNAIGNYTNSEQFYFSQGRYNTVEVVFDSKSNYKNIYYDVYGSQTTQSSKFYQDTTNPISQTTNDINSSETQLNSSSMDFFGYTGKPLDKASNLYNYGFRDYDAELNIFTTADPIRDGMNWYSMCIGNPIDFYDLWGLSITSGVILSDEHNKISETFFEHMDSRIQGLKNIIDHYEEIIEFLKDAQHKVMKAEIYQPGAGGNYHKFKFYNKETKEYYSPTWCNQATFDILEALGFDLSCFTNGVNRYNIGAKAATINALENAKKADSRLLEVNGKVAQVFANSGIIVIGMKEGSNHLATVNPTGQKADKEGLPSIANVGASNGIKSTRDAFGNNAVKENRVKFFIDLNQPKGYSTGGNEVASYRPEVIAQKKEGYKDDPCCPNCNYFVEGYSFRKTGEYAGFYYDLFHSPEETN